MDELPPVPLPTVEFIAYGADVIISGYTALDADRLTDMLERDVTFALVDAFVERRADGVGEHMPAMVVEREDLYLVHAAGPRGRDENRLRRRPFPLHVRLGAYDVRGYLHTHPGVDPISRLTRGASMVPLTSASVEYVSGGVWHRRAAGTVIVNRHRLDDAAIVADEDLQLPPMTMALDQVHTEVTV
jgi:hypothetical protein